MATNELVHDVTQQDFEEAVIRRSYEVPVVVDFWAPWCGPCRSLGPILERLAGAAKGAWELVKLNTDQNPALAQRYRIQSIPAVKGFRDGEVVAEFIGAQPETAIRAFLQRLVPSAAEESVAEGRRMLAAGRSAEAEAAFRAALTAEPGQPKALLALGEVLLQTGNWQEAAPLLQSIPVQTAEGRQAAPLLGRLHFLQEASALADEASVPSDEPAAVWAGGVRAAAQGDYRTALERFLTLVEQHRRFNNDAGRKAMIAVFDILGPEDPLTVEFRPRLATALY